MGYAVGLRFLLRFLWFWHILSDVFGSSRSRKLAGEYRFRDLDHYRSLGLVEDFHAGVESGYRSGYRRRERRLAADHEGLTFDLDDLCDRVAPTTLLGTLRESYKDIVDKGRARRRVAKNSGIQNDGPNSQAIAVPNTLWSTFCGAYWRCIADIRARRRVAALTEVKRVNDQANKWITTVKKRRNT